MTIQEMHDEIVRLKKENDIYILAHSYQTRDVTEVADFVGDSYALAKKAQTVPHKNVIMCGVRFMAETVKILSPEKRVFLSNADAGCPMAEQMDKELISQMKEMYPDYAVVAYINTTSDLKTICDVCVTSSSAVKILKAMPEKNFKLVHGGCPTHARLTVKNVEKVKAQHPNAKFLVHPECVPDVVKLADYVGSTSGIMEYAKASSDKEFIIGTENSIVQHLQFDCPDKKFYPASKDLVCHNMKATTLSDVLSCCKFSGGEEITLDEELRLAAKRSIDKMIEYGG